MNKTGNRIRARRIALGLSQEELGARVGIKKATINKYESGLIVNLKRSMIEKLAVALEVSPVYLLGLEDPEPSSGLSETQIKLIDAVKRMTEEQAAAVWAIVEQIEARHKGQDSQ